MYAAIRGENEGLSQLIEGKADLNLQNKVRWSEAVVLVSGCNIDCLVLESRSWQRWHYEGRI